MDEKHQKSMDIVEKLAKLSELRESGAFTDSEFQTLKERVIADDAGSEPESPKHLDDFTSDELEDLMMKHGLVGAAEQLGVLAADLDQARKKHDLSTSKKSSLRQATWRTHATRQSAHTFEFSTGEIVGLAGSALLVLGVFCPIVSDRGRCSCP
jgi:hypothetical protein